VCSPHSNCGERDRPARGAAGRGEGAWVARIDEDRPVRPLAPARSPPAGESASGASTLESDATEECSKESAAGSVSESV
jgi:hypothetical protein